MDKKSFQNRNFFISTLTTDMEDAVRFAKDIIYTKQYTMTFTESMLIDSMMSTLKALRHTMKETEARITSG